MCHCFSDPTEMSNEERAALVDEHSSEELRAQYSTGELEALGVPA